MIYNKINEFKEINKEDNFTYYLDSNKINNLLNILYIIIILYIIKYDNNIQNNIIRHERMVDYLNKVIFNINLYKISFIIKEEMKYNLFVYMFN